MKPFAYKLNQPNKEKDFNYRLSKCRRVIENAFGQLKARFRKVGRGLEVATENVNVIIKACCMLHNFSKVENDHVRYTWVRDAKSAASTAPSQPRYTTRAGENNVEAKVIRDAIALSFRK
ncbi:uncharacterized protein LOC119662928 [Teleopsis dalmanni]|uniref:uncharacterized protein LOC119662928 n=1 Tax=Teleopsis dalmanni TaxID=139649 RepID=UPI0018CF861C|nr:uncharacterized protein LOC119662928 [Teleopsis dalmanni]